MDSGYSHSVLITAQNLQVIAMLIAINLKNYIMVPNDVGNIQMTVEKTFKPGYSMIRNPPCVAPILH